MAQPLPKSTWQSFQHDYSTTHPGSSKQQVSQAWAEYKTTHNIAATKKSNPIRSPSPKRSPKKTHMHTLVGATLTQLPPGVGQLITQYLPAKSIAILQRTSQRTKAITKQQMETVCNELPNTNELINSIRNTLVSPVIWTIRYLSFHTDGQRGDQITVNVAKFGAGNAVGTTLTTTTDGVTSGGEQLNLSTFDVYIQSQQGHVDPYSLLSTFKRRVGCTKQDIFYMADIVKEYVIKILRPLLVPLVDTATIEMLFNDPTGVPNNIQLLLQPDDDMYRPAARMLITMGYWLELDVSNVADMTELVRDLIDWQTHTFAAIKSFFVFIQNRQQLTHALVDVLIPTVTTNQVSQYLQQRLRSKEPFVLSLLSKVKTHIHNDYVLIRIEQTKKDVTYTQYKVPVRHEYEHDTVQPFLEPLQATQLTAELLQSNLRSTMYGVVDPFTAKSINNEVNREWITLMAIQFNLRIHHFLNSLDRSRSSATQVKNRVRNEAEQYNNVHYSRLCLFAIWCGAKPSTVWTQLPINMHNDVTPAQVRVLVVAINAILVAVQRL